MWLALVGWVALTMVGAIGAAERRAEEIAVVVNASGPLTSLTVADVRALYLGERQFVGMDHVGVLHLPEGDTKGAFLFSVVGMTLKEYKLHWVQRVFQEGTSLPRVVAGPSAMAAEVSMRLNSLGYLPARVVKDTPGLKVLFVLPSP
ncbi:MAG: hypothetical protein HY207_04610 [Nitrospirae bacterium]|nr:hypothetical protein [Nitrospirota bacterium]